jgi:hypothetical protein
MKEQEYDVKFMSVLIKTLAIAFKWICLINCVLCAGFSIGLLVMLMVKGNNIPSTMLSTMVSLITKFEYAEVSDLVEIYGLGKLMVATLGYGFAVSVYYGVLHSLLYKFIILFDSIIDGEMFNKENIKLINGSLLQAIIASFILPLTIAAIQFSTNVLSLTDINMSSILIIIVVYILKIIFTSGYELKNANNSKIRELNKLKANIESDKILTLKNKNLEVKETTKKVNNKRNNKKTTNE